MGLKAPPPPLSPEEFTKRYNAGARTIKELDPDFAKHIKSGLFGFLFKKRVNKKI